MVTPLEKALRDPDSTKAKILAAARRVFGEYGYHGTTTRVIANESGFDISTLHYHWGDKKDLYEAVVMDINRQFRQVHIDIEKVVHGSSLQDRLTISIDKMVDFLFEYPEISNLMLHRYLTKIREEANIDINISETAMDIAFAMNLEQDKSHISSSSLLKVLALMNSIHHFVSGEEYFRSVLNLGRDEYIDLVKETIKFINVPAFVARNA